MGSSAEAITGLTTSEAFHKLYKALKDEIFQDIHSHEPNLRPEEDATFSSEQDAGTGSSLFRRISDVSRKLHSELNDGLNHSYRSSLEEQNVSLNCPWTYCRWYSICLFLAGTMTIFGGALSRTPSPIKTSVILSGCVMLLLFLLNILLSVKVYKMKRGELVCKAKLLLEKLEKSIKKGDLSSLGDALLAPQSESIHLQWTYRDGILVNLPWILLVENDIILLRPGREAPCRCNELGNTNRGFVPGQIFLSHEVSDPRVQHGIKRLDPILCRVIETPAARYFRTCFRSQKRAPTLMENELYKVIHLFNERIILPLALACTFIAVTIRLLQFEETAGSITDMILIQSVACMVPLLGVSLPVFVTVVNIWNLASLISEFDCQSSPGDSSESSSTTELFVEQKNSESQFNRNALFSTCSQFRTLVSGRSLSLPFSANLVHVMGNVTSVSVVDKKGLLSLPNPTPEKVFFFKDADPGQHSGAFVCRQHSKVSLVQQAATEVLSLTHEQDRAFSSNFDDPFWPNFLPNLKPIGLNILLNSCNLSEEYLQFLDHVHVVSEWVPRTIAVVNRRCFCNLAKLMGFDPEITCGQFRPEGTVAAYKKVAGEAPVPGLTKHRTPLPNVFASVSSDLVSVNEHVMAQGTADLLMNMCSHAWTGMDMIELSRSSKKKILDFYQRHSITSYCVGFSYRPLVSLEPREKMLTDTYISWPLKHCDDEEKKQKSACKTILESPTNKNSVLSGAFSMESMREKEKEETTIVDEKPLLNDHIFLGIVTLQYQAKPDVVRLVEHLDKACIRLVHFSKENELRSRIFAEKMGLEAGWNCHVSLASEGSADLIRTHSLPTSVATMENGYPLVSNAVLKCRSLPSDMKIYSKMMVKEESNVEFRQGSVMISTPEDLSLDSTDDSNSCHNEGGEAEKSPLLSEQTSRTSAGDTSADIPNSSAFIIPNRAQLPKGVENVRPHLETKDNVPLLVNLFTDCDHKSSREMLEIMQEYGEIVLVVGSSLNYHNADIFCQANASLAVEPLHPTLCIQDQKNSSSAGSSMKWATLLASLPCALRVNNGKRINLLELLGFARHRLALLRSALIFLYSSSMFLFLLRVVALLLFLPPIYDLPQILLWVLMILPTLGFSLCVTPDSRKESLKMSTPKNQKWVPRKMVIAYGLGFLLKFFPAIIVLVLIFGSVLPILCQKIPERDCWWYFVNETSSVGSWGGWATEYNTGLVVAQQMVSCFVTLYFCVISMGFVHFRENLLRCSPFQNRVWILACFLSLLLQMLYSFCVFAVDVSHDVKFGFSDVPWPVWFSGCICIVPLVVTGELYKRHEIKLYRRDQRRRGLSFGTKLGLNSPW